MYPVVLLVEDNSSDEKLAVLALRKSGIDCPIVVAHDGVEAMEYLLATGRYAGRDLSAVPAVVLLDLKLPRVDGLEVLRRIRGDLRTNLLPVVVLTGSRLEEDVVRCYSAGANAYVRKPVEFSEFAEVARTLGGFWLRLNQTVPHGLRRTPG
jgi:two-component system response regulator